MGVPATNELTDFLVALADRPDGTAARNAAVECAARALGADVAVLTIDEGVMAAYGIPVDRVPAFGVAEVAAGRRTTLELGGRPHAATAATVAGDSPGALVVARDGAEFTAEEVCLLRGMAGVLELSLQALHVIESERRHARENDRLVGSLKERQRLLEQLSAIQRAIARRSPLPEILQAITSGARELLGAEMAGLNLVETDDRTLGSMVACSGVAPELLARLKRVPLVAGGVSGLAILGDELVFVADYGNSPIAVPGMAKASLKSAMAVPVHSDSVVVGSLVVGSYSAHREWDKASQEVLTVFAEHVSLALTDAHTLEAMNQGFHDSLTGLAGRALFRTRMESAFAAATDGGVATLFIDLDRFKVVNDSLGHAAGDLLLVSVAERISACLRAGDTAARLGGDEFAVLLAGVGGVDKAVPVARRIMAALRKPFDLCGSETSVTCSVGIAFAAADTSGASDASELMVHADLAVYQAKKLGKDRYEIFEPAMQASFQAALAMEADLRRAVVRHEFELRYQPIVHLRTAEITGLEALVRWQHPQRGIIPPLEFIPLAEQTGLIVPIGEWVLREACQQTARWNERRGEHPLSVSVNLSAVQLDQGDLPELVESALDDSGLPPSCLVIELTESLVVDHRPGTLEQLERLKALGVRLAIDDFGTGYSSLAYLRRFPVDIIKIDKSFVDDVGDDLTAAALTLGIIQLGQALQLSTVAEGIEDIGQLNELTDGNCELGQGYYFAEPLPGQAMDDLLFPPA
jgi:diguanylate cyclase (GGDEF)-like protein